MRRHDADGVVQGDGGAVGVDLAVAARSP